jgi:hypothetical protein
MYAQYFHHSHTPTHFPYILSPPTGNNHPNRTYFASLFSVFVKNTWYFCLFKMAVQGISLWPFHVYMYHNLTDSSPISFAFYLSILLMVSSTGLKILYSFL